MAKETKVWEIIKSAGYDPIENKNIIVSYAPRNLSDSIVKFLGCSNEFFVLQICKDALVLVPFGKLMMELKKEVALEIPLNTIKQIEVKPNGLNYSITIETKTDVITLSAQQKELSDMRFSGMLGNNGIVNKNWHKENLDKTLDMLKNLVK